MHSKDAATTSRKEGEAFIEITQPPLPSSSVSTPTSPRLLHIFYLFINHACSKQKKDLKVLIFGFGSKLHGITSVRMVIC